MFKGKNLRLIALTVFVILFTMGLITYSQKANAAGHEAVIGLGVGIIHLDDSSKSQSIGYRYDERWEFRYTRTGEAQNRDNEPVDANDKLEVMRVIKFRNGHTFRPLMKFGVAYWQDVPETLVNERLQYSLVVGLAWQDVIELSWAHNSTAGRSEPNSGIDYVALDFTMRF